MCHPLLASGNLARIKVPRSISWEIVIIELFNHFSMNASTLPPFYVGRHDQGRPIVGTIIPSTRPHRAWDAPIPLLVIPDKLESIEHLPENVNLSSKLSQPSCLKNATRAT